MDSVLEKLAKSAASDVSLESLTRPLLELLESVTGLDSTYLTTIDESKGVQHILFARNSRKLDIAEGLSFPANEVKPVHGITTYLSEPVRVLDGELFGTLCAASDRPVAVPERAVKVLGLFARIIAHQIERERMLEVLRTANAELVSHASSDPLTGIPNRRALLAELKRGLARVKRDGTALHIAFLDLDGFKTINDQYGHDAGDRMLIAIADRLTAELRGSDFIARIGGDEFVVVAPTNGHDDEAGARDLCHKLSALTKSTFEIGERAIEFGGASVGVVTSKQGDQDADALLQRADRAMVEIKRARRMLNSV